MKDKYSLDQKAIMFFEIFFKNEPRKLTYIKKLDRMLSDYKDNPGLLANLFALFVKAKVYKQITSPSYCMHKIVIKNQSKLNHNDKKDKQYLNFIKKTIKYVIKCSQVTDVIVNKVACRSYKNIYYILQIKNLKYKISTFDFTLKDPTEDAIRLIDIMSVKEAVKIEKGYKEKI